MRFETVDVGSARLNVAMTGDPANPLIICLHGFPEYWAGWAAVMERLADRFFVVAPDQRGYNLSSRPAGVEAYRLKHLVQDLAGLADQLSPDRSFVLAGHDWGSSVAIVMPLPIRSGCRISSSPTASIPGASSRRSSRMTSSAAPAST
jgi:pimeloyl-ACP methyl ester carboxylesterase